jgi:hypothetical protein
MSLTTNDMDYKGYLPEAAPLHRTAEVPWGQDDNIVYS